jgi:integral membrane sensor domain MASE1
MRILETLLIALALLVATSPAFAQGCSMCYASAAAQQAEAQRALNLGIIVLIIPPVLLFAGVMVTAFRRRDESDAES